MIPIFTNGTLYNAQILSLMQSSAVTILSSCLHHPHHHSH